MPHRPLTLFPAHASQHPALNGGTAAFVSGENPRYPAEKQGNDDLEHELEGLGLDYERTKGKYGAPEGSFVVMNPSLDQAIGLGRKFGQESVAWTENGRHQLHFVNGPQAGQATAPAEGHKFSESEPQDNYTAIPGPHGEPYGYATFNMDFDSPMVPSRPTPLTEQQVEPMAKSELAIEVNAWLERLGELRTREMAKSEAEANLYKTAPPGFSEETMHELKREHGVKSAFKIAWAAHNKKMGKAEPTNSDAYFHPSDSKAKKPAPAGPPAVNTYRAVPKDYRKGEDIGSAVAMISGDVHKIKKSDAYERESIRRVREAENKELANIPLRDPNKQSIPQSGKVSSIAEERQMGKTEDGKSLEKGWKGAAMGAAMALAPGAAHAGTPAARPAHVINYHAPKAVPPGSGAAGTNTPESDVRTAKGPMVSPSEKITKKAESSKVDPLDDMNGHACRGCKSPMSPVVAALRKGHGGMCLKCSSGMAKGELKYHNNEPQHNQNDREWKPNCKVVEAPGSGGQTKKNPVGTSSNDGAKSIDLPLKAGAPSTHQHAGPAQTLTKDEQGEHPAGGRPSKPGAPGPMSVHKAESMPVPSAPKAPQAPGAKPTMTGGTTKPSGSSPAKPPGGPTGMPMGKSESLHKTEGAPHHYCARCGKKNEKPSSHHLCASCQCEEESAEDAGMVTGVVHHDSKTGKELHKAIRETISLRKALSFGGGPSNIKQGRQQASFDASKQPTGLPAAGKIQPKSPAEYDAASFRPGSPGAAGAPSGLELDTSVKRFPQGHGTNPGQGATAIPTKTYPGHIAKLRGVRGAPLSQQKV